MVCKYTVALHVENAQSLLKQISSIQTESQPANAVPPNLESVCESVESEADPLNV